MDHSDLIWLRGLLCAGAITLFTGSAAADTDADRATARSLFFDAVAAVDAGEHKKAADLFDRSNQLHPAPTAALGLARALERSGEWVRATETYYGIVRRKPDENEPDAFRRATEAAQLELAALNARMPSVILSVTGGVSVTVVLDEAEVPQAALGVARPVDPGAHTIVVSAPGYETVTRTVVAEAGVALPVAIELVAVAPAAAPIPVAPPKRPAPVEPPPPVVPRDDGRALRITGYVLGAVGLAGFVGVAVTGAMYLSADATKDAECASDTSSGAIRCTPAGLAAVDRGRSVEPINTAMFIVGGIGVAAGIAFTIAGNVGEEPVAASVVVSPAHAALELRF